MVRTRVRQQARSCPPEYQDKEHFHYVTGLHQNRYETHTHMMVYYKNFRLRMCYRQNVLPAGFVKNATYEATVSREARK